MKNEDKWIQDIRNRMEDYSEPLPAGMWEQLESELDTPKVIPMWRKWQAAAAAVLVLAVSSLTLWFWSSPEADKLSKESRIAQQQIEKAVQPVVTPVEPVSEPDAGQLAKVSEPLPRAAKVLLAVQNPVIAAEENVTEPVPEADMVAQPVETRTGEQAEQPSKEKAEENIRKLRAADRKQLRQKSEQAMNLRSKGKKQNWSVGVTAGNIPYSNTNTFNGFSRLTSRTATPAINEVCMAPLDDNTVAYSTILTSEREQTSNTHIHHHVPVTAGMSFKWNLTPQWAVETGLMYTYLSTDLTSGSDRNYWKDKHKLHYLGIPLKVHRNIWSNERFGFYGSAGGMLEKCVSGTLETVYVINNEERESESHSLKVSSPQWSVSAAVGAQVNFTRQLGLYVEPGVVYYFDDHSGIETIRKEHPLNFNLQMGLRFSFP